MADKYLEERRNAIVSSKTVDEIDTVLNKVYEDGFEDGSNSD